MAKNDIRGVSTGEDLSDVLDYLVLDGARCENAQDNNSITCRYDEKTKFVLDVGRTAPRRIEKIAYFFSFKDPSKIKARICGLYNLKEESLTGEHILSSGERLFVTLDDRGTGSLSITNDAQIRQDHELDDSQRLRSAAKARPAKP